MFEKILYYLKSLLKQHFKIGIISYYYPVEKNMNNGVALHVYALAKELAKNGCEIHIFTRTEKKLIKREYIGDGLIVVHGIEINLRKNNLDFTVEKRMKYFMFDNKVINEIFHENSLQKFDIIHTHGWLTAGAFISKHINKIPWVHTLHALEKNRLKFMTPEERRMFQIAKWMESNIESADAIITVSHNLKKESLKEYSLKEKKVFVIPNGVDKKVFFRDETVEKKRKVLYVGRFSLEKGIDFLPHIAQQVLDANEKVQFVAVALDNMPASLENVKKQFLYLSDTYKERFIWIKEAMSSEELRRLYNESEIYIQPSRYESFGMTVLEAMACGCAVITSNRGGMPEVVGNAGILIPPNISLFSRKILQFLDNSRLRERYSRRAIERSNLFNWEEIARRILDLYLALSRKKISESHYNILEDINF